MDQPTGLGATGEPSNVDVAEETHSVQSEISMIASPAGGSINYPYRSLLKDTSFPRCHLMARPGSRAETFNGSLRALGHGTPLLNPHGVLPEPTPGIAIGDVGYLHHNGGFQTFFNIFLPPNHPAQSKSCPPDLIPLDPPLDSELAVNPTHFSPGTVLVGKGIETTTLSSTPLDIKFTVHGREGGILILPDGGSREDLLSTTRIRDYVQQHALSWYISVNKGLGAVVHPNATLYVVTGADKALNWANCVTYSSKTQLNRLWKPSEIIYRGARGDARQYWEHSRETRARFLCQRSREIGDEHFRTRALFIRGMRFAVNVRDWTEHLLHYNPPSVTLFHLIRTVPNLGLRAKLQTLKECLPGYSETVPMEDGIGIRVLFHPLDVLLRILLEESPSSTMAYAEDHIWCSATNKMDANLSSIMDLLAEILETHESLAEHDIVTLVPRKSEPQEPAPTTSPNMLIQFSTYFQGRYRVNSQRREILNRLAKVFPGPGVPKEMLGPQRL